jgi:hypothetical protein
MRLAQKLGMNLADERGLTLINFPHALPWLPHRTQVQMKQFYCGVYEVERRQP